MSILSKIIDSVKIEIKAAEEREVIKPFGLNNIVLPINYLVQINKGYAFDLDNQRVIKEGEFTFRPTGSIINVKYGKSSSHKMFGPELFSSDEERLQYMKRLNPSENHSKKEMVFSFVAFDVLLYENIPLFKVLDLPFIPMPYDQELSTLIQNICVEFFFDRMGKDRLLKNYTEEVVVQIFRYISTQPQYSKNVNKVDYLFDKRLVSIIQYIQEHLGDDLSNKKIAEVAFLSEDYIGQFFKSLTGMNMQDYVENQRLDKALALLNLSEYNVQQISAAVGFKDPAYFSRRFKMKFNINANAVRKTERKLI